MINTYGYISDFHENFRDFQKLFLVFVRVLLDTIPTIDVRPREVPSRKGNLRSLSLRPPEGKGREGEPLAGGSGERGRRENLSRRDEGETCRREEGRKAKGSELERDIFPSGRKDESSRGNIMKRL